ncbi:MAG TPA: lipase family protein, partial [Polyangiaceae bacterium]
SGDHDDAGVTASDSGTPIDRDAGSKGEDAAVDAGSIRVDVPAVACADSVDDVYVPPSSLGAMSDATRGDVVRCAPDGTLSAADAQTAILSKGVPSFTATSGVSIYRAAFRTWRGNQSAGISSARVYLPQSPLATLPVIVIGHPTTGMGPSFAPSKDPGSLEDLALPWAALGYAVIAPDYAGLGTPGVQGYVDNHDTAFSMIDAARALRKFVSPGAFTSQVLMAGHSQGGGAVLASQALAKTYGNTPDFGTLVGAIVFAPEYPTRLNSFDYSNMIHKPNDLTVTTGISNCVVGAYREYAYFSNYVAAATGTEAFPSTQASTEVSMMMSLGQTEFGAYLHGTDLHLGDLFDADFRTSLQACMDGTAGCAARESAYLSFLQQNILTADASGAKVLYVQGLLDEVMTPADEAACNVQKLKSDGVTPTVCVDAAAEHTKVTPRNIAYAIAWGQAILAGGTPPSCGAFNILPPCNP